MHRFMKLKHTDQHWVVFIFSCLAVCVLLPGIVFGATFAVRISPPNFELKAKPGEILRNIITIENADMDTGIYSIRTADWDLNAQGGVIIHPQDKALASGSCRPWTRLERTKLQLVPGKAKRYRFEVHVPDDIQNGWCKFAIVVAPAPGTFDSMQMGNLSVPITGSIAVIVYVTVGDAAPDLVLEGAKRINTDGAEPLAMLSLKNRGNAHARPFGNLAVTDLNGKSAELMIIPFPVLPGETRDIQLGVDSRLSGIEKMSELVFPISLKGLIEWEGGSARINTSIK